MRQSLFIGKLESKPEVRYTQSGTPVSTLYLNVLERKGESWEAHKFRISVFGKNAERVARQAREGSEIVAICKPESREYKDREGRTRRSEDHVASWIRVCVTDGTEADDAAI